MLERHQQGDLPAKHHITLRDGEGRLRWEECLTRDGFEGPYTILYHEHRPHEAVPAEVDVSWRKPVAAPAGGLLRRHFRSQELPEGTGSPLEAHRPMLFNKDVVIGISKPSAPDPVYRVNGDGDDLIYVFKGSGTLRTVLGDLRFEQDDYVYIPKGIIHRLIPDEGVEQYWLHIECLGGMGLLSQFRNDVGQLRMDAPYCHRDFRKPVLGGVQDEGIRLQVVKRNQELHGFRLPNNPLDCVGWDGTVYPWVFPILNFQPRAGLVHLPPTWHGTFAARGALICSFVPRAVDFHPEAIPCPYPHTSVDVDEFLFYCRGNFTSRRGVGPGSISFHPKGLPHGPHPGSYERSIGHRETDEMAVMLDCYEDLIPTPESLGIEDADYHQSFVEGPT